MKGKQQATSHHRQNPAAGHSSGGSDHDPQHTLGNAAVQDLLAGGSPADSPAPSERGGGGTLPGLSRIQESFGSYDVSGVAAHAGEKALEACEDIGAGAFATGNAVFLGDLSDLHTVAHEAAHVVQQRAGVSVAGGFGDEGDRYEENADAVADRVVAGKSAEDLLDEIAGDQGKQPSGSGGEAPIQRKVTVRKRTLDDLEAAWTEVSTREPLASLDTQPKAKAKGVLKSWIAAYPKSSNPFSTSQDRVYDQWTHLARALAGEVASEDNLDREFGMAQQVYADLGVEANLQAFVRRLRVWHGDRDGMKLEAAKTKGRYAYYYSSIFNTLWSGGRTLQEALDDPPTDLEGIVTLAADYAVAMRKKGGDDDRWDAHMDGELSAARKNHWNPDEGAKWTKKARENSAPLSAGPSATTDQLLTFAGLIGANKKEKTALAWGIFAFFNQGLSLHQSGTHRFHEVMAVAASHDVDYTPWKYGEVPELD